MSGARVAKKIQKRWMHAFVENPSLPSRPHMTIMLTIDERGRAVASAVDAEGLDEGDVVGRTHVVSLLQMLADITLSRSAR